MPRDKYALDVIKDGIVVSTIDLSERSHYVVGRHPSCAQVVLEHPSISRQHVIIQHRDSGDVYLFDPGSTHGTYLNKQRLPPREHVPCPVGSTVKLGQSTRLLCLLGPSREETTDQEREREAKRNAAHAAHRMKARAEELARRTGKSLVKAEDLHSKGAGWGFDDEAVEDRSHKEDDTMAEMSFEALYAQAKAKGLNLTPKQERLVEQLERRSQKLANLAMETEKISAKEWEGLSEGQKTALGRNEARSTELKEQIASLQDQIADSIREQLGAKSALEGKKQPKRGAAAATAADDDDDGDDDFFDRTSKKGKGAKAARGGAAAAAAPSAAAPAAAESEESLREKLHALDRLLSSAARQEAALLAEIEASQAKGGSIDPLEAFMSSNTARVRTDKLADCRTEQVKLQQEHARLHRLLKLVVPALPPMPAMPPMPAAARPPPAAAPPAAVPPAAAPVTAAAPVAAAPTKRAVPSAGMAATLEAMRAAGAGEAGPAAGAADNEPEEPAAKRPRAEGGSHEASKPAPPARPAPPASAAERFRADFAAAAAACSSGALGDDEVGTGDSGGVAKPAQAEAAEAEEGLLVEAPAKRDGLGFGGQAPGRDLVGKLRETMAAQQEKAQREAAMRPGLNTKVATGGGGTQKGPVGPAARPTVAGPSTGPPREDRRLERQPAEQADEDGFAWAPPTGQDGTGKTALNKKLGY